VTRGGPAESYLLDLISSTRRYMDDLRRENEALVALLADVSADPPTLVDALERSRAVGAPTERPVGASEDEVRALADGLRRELDAHRSHRSELIRRVAQIESSSRAAATQRAEVEQQYATLTNLFVATHRLHETLDRNEVLTTLEDIVINIVGSEEIAIYEHAAGRLTLASSFGLGSDPATTLPADRGPVGRAVSSGAIVLGRDLEDDERVGAAANLTAAVPLKVGERVIAVVVIYRLLRQKPVLTPGDEELLDLLATHGGTALYCTRLHARERITEPPPRIRAERRARGD
jgi:hypothetical protein